MHVALRRWDAGLRGSTLGISSRAAAAGRREGAWVVMHSPCRTCSMGVEASPTSGTGWLTLQRELRRKAAPKTCNRAGRAHGNVDEA